MAPIQKPLPRMIPEPVGGADIVRQDLHRPVPAELLHLEDRRALACRLGQEAGAQQVAGEPDGARRIPAIASLRPPASRCVPCAG